MTDPKPGHRFRRWTIISTEPNPDYPREWLCKCECGTTRYVLRSRLRAGLSSSCGCYRGDMATRVANGRKPKEIDVALSPGRRDREIRQGLRCPGPCWLSGEHECYLPQRRAA